MDAGRRRKGRVRVGGRTPKDLVEFLEHSAGAVVMVCGLFALLGYMYMAGTADPQNHMRHLPWAVVNSDRGATLDTPIGPQHLDLGTQVVGGLMDNNDWSRLDLHVVSPEEAEEGLQDARYYGVVTVPEDLSENVAGLLDGTARTDGPPATPGTITVSSSPRLSLAGAQVGQRLVDALQHSADERIGGTVLDKGTQLAQARNQQAPATAAAALAHPVSVHAATWNPLPPGISNGTMPMFYALVVILAGFTGAMVISNVLDARLGFMPIEVGPLSVALEVAPHGRLRVLVRKWAVTAITAPLVSGIYLLIAKSLGLGGFSYVDAFAFSVLAILAVGIAAHAIIAAMGSFGLLVNLVVFVVLGIPTSGGTTPPEMLPEQFKAIGSIEPMHLVYNGLRSIMFFDSRGSTGLTHGAWVLLAWLVSGLVVGVLAASYYDRVGLRRQRVDPRIGHDEVREALARRRAGASGRSGHGDGGRDAVEGPQGPGDGRQEDAVPSGATGSE